MRQALAIWGAATLPLLGCEGEQDREPATRGCDRRPGIWSMPPPADPDEVVVAGMSADGCQIVGVATMLRENAAPESRRFVWDGAEQLTTFEATPDAKLEFNGLSADAHHAVGYRSVHAIPNHTEAVRWTIGGAVESLGAGVRSRATQVSGDGSVVIGTEYEGRLSRFLWSGGEPSWSEIPEGVFAVRMDTTGRYFATLDEGADESGWLYWERGQEKERIRATELGCERVFAPRISAAGDTLVGECLREARWHVVRWTRARGVETLPLSSEDYPLIAAMSSDARSLVVYDSAFGPLSVYRDGSDRRALDALMAEAGVELSAYRSLVVEQLSDDGRVILGAAEYPGVANRAPVRLVLPAY